MLTKMLDEAQVQRFQNYIDRAERFVLMAHVSPDGDAIGASLGMYHFLTEIGKEQVDVIVPNEFPAFLKWMPGTKDILVYERYPEYAQQLISEADVLFNMDYNEPKRAGKLAPFIEAAEGRKVMIDHHPNPGDFCRLVISYPIMSSTSELVFRLLCAIKSYDDINKEAAECLYTGMMTDTGAFTYNSNRADIYTVVGELIKKGIDKDEIYRKVYQMKVYPELRTALITLSLEELNRYSYVTGDTEGFVNMPLSIDGIDFSVFIRESSDQIKISLRSVGEFPCNHFAANYFGGGGHKNASGGEYYGTLEEAVRTFERGLAELNPTVFAKSPR